MIRLRKATIFLLVAVLLAGIAPLSAVAADDHLSKLPFSSSIVGNTQYSDCVGKPVIVVFGRVTCSNTTTVLPLIDQLITQNNLQGKLNLLFFDSDQPSADIRTYFSDKGFQNVSAYRGGTSVMWNILRSKTSISGSVAYPVVAYFSSSGNVTEVTTASTLLADVINNTLDIIDANIDIYSLPIMAAHAGNVEKHGSSRTDHAALIYYRDYGIDKIESTVRQKSLEVTATAKTDYDKILAVHDWVAQNIYYDFDDFYGITKNNKYDSATVLSTRKSTCEGFSNLAIDMLRIAGVPVKKVYGYALGLSAKKPILEGTTNHAWTEAYADGRWVVFDTTWDTGNEWRNGAIAKSGGMHSDRPYFDPKMEDLSLSHRIDTYDPDSRAITTPSDWAEADVNRANSLLFVPDVLNKAYQNNITRAEFCALATLLYESIKGEITGRKAFADTKDINVEKMASLDVVTGVGNNRFNPNGELTREQAAAILSRLANSLGCSLADSAPTFADNAKISDWAVADVGKIQAGGIMSGVGSNSFSPQGRYTHEQSIVTALRIWDRLQ